MIEKLTSEQEAKIAEYRDRYFRQATSTDTADRPRAESAARRLAEIGGVVVREVIWVHSPQAGQEAVDRAWASLRDSLWASLRASLWDSLWASLRDSGWTCLYRYCADVLGVQYDERSAELLHLYDEIAASCFAVSVVPGSVVLCERPEAVEIVDGRLVGLTWREE